MIYSLVLLEQQNKSGNLGGNMTIEIDLSLTSQELIAQLVAIDPSLTQTFTNPTKIDKKNLYAWLEQNSKIASGNPAFFLITSLRASLLKDIYKSLNPGQIKEETPKGGMTAKAKYALLALAGTVYFGCEGFDGITAILGVFSSIPTIALFVAGTLFSVLSMVVFYSFDLVEISKNLGIKSTDTKKLLDVLLDEVKQIQAIRMRLAKTSKKTKEELEEDLQIATMLLQRYKDLEQIRNDLTSASNNPYLQAAKYITAGVAGILFFSGGFFAGQTVALAIAGLFVTSMAATAWPIIVAGIAVGLAALSVYWFVERPGIENLISRWRGLDKKKMDKLCKSDVVKKETEELEELISSINFKIDLLVQHESDQLEIKSLKEELSALEAEKEAALLQAQTGEIEISNLKAELEKMKEQQAKPNVGIAKHEEHVAPDTIKFVLPLHRSSDDNELSPRQRYSLFKSASTGHLLDLGRSSTLDNSI
ncbi:coiled-coil protein [Legionella tucsonensis]|uniref:Coiled-coil protein n=2 Tax=Legionella tucsonensis TaxID=40335 RepID=A0A0W0ZNZ0_9GAMM|nr:coiled-coil protein [Legionella tucsonensis]